MKKNKKHLFPILFFAFFVEMTSFSYAQSQAFAGIWEGVLHFGPQSLKLVFVASPSADSLTAVLDSPDQYATDIPIDKLVIKGDTLYFDSEDIGVVYTGVRQGDSIVGKFMQRGQRRKLTLRRTTERKLFPRPQEPQEPFPYYQKELEFGYAAGKPNITGTLTLPASGNPKAVAVLISGSGWQNRDEEICGHKPFKLLADALTRAGYAVFRYDDAPARFFQTMTTYDFADQVQVILDTLSQRDDLKSVPIGLIGHSEGGMVAWIVASKSKKVDFVISLAGMGTPLRRVLLYQVMGQSVKEKLPSEQLQSNLQLSDAIYALIEKAKSAEKARSSVRDFLEHYAENLSLEQRKELNLTTEGIMATCLTLGSDWYYALMTIQPEKYMAKVKCPVLALNGDRDTQVDAVENLAAIRTAMKKNSACTTEVLPRLNHLFQECETGYFEEYGDISQTLCPDVWERIISWLEEIGN